MNYLTCSLINDEEIKTITKDLKFLDKNWEDGKRTAGRHAAAVKNNLQLSRKSDISQKYADFITKRMLTNPLIKSFSLAKRIHGIMFTRSSKGMRYGRHIDNAFMSTGRADLSFTIFINKKYDYEGGELVVEDLIGENKFKLNEGEIIIYPSSYLHSVKEVESGERIVCVGWIESYVKSIEEREYLFDIDAGAKGLLAKYGRTDELDLIFKSYSNLLRILGN